MACCGGQHQDRRANLRGIIPRRGAAHAVRRYRPGHVGRQCRAWGLLDDRRRCGRSARDSLVRDCLTTDDSRPARPCRGDVSAALAGMILPACRRAQRGASTCGRRGVSARRSHAGNSAVDRMVLIGAEISSRPPHSCAARCCGWLGSPARRPLHPRRHRRAGRRVVVRQPIP